MYLYLIKNKTVQYNKLGRKLNYVKIGVSKDPLKRLKQLQTGNHLILQIFLTIEFKDSLTARNKEKALHNIFKKYRSCNEWFCFEDLNIITDKVTKMFDLENNLLFSNSNYSEYSVVKNNQIKGLQASINYYKNSVIVDNNLICNLIFKYQKKYFLLTKPEIIQLITFVFSE